MRVSLFVHDLSSNPIVRAATVARALQQMGHEIEILGFLVAGQEVYEPFRDQFRYKTIRVSRRVTLQAARLARMATGDIAYAFKPLLTSLLPACLYARFGVCRRLFLDAEDNELWVQECQTSHGRRWMLRCIRTLFPRLLAHLLVPFARRRTVVSSALRRRYGGTLLLHGPDTAEFDPLSEKHDPKRCRMHFGLPTDVPLVLFVGTPRAHKGLSVLVDALLQLRDVDYNLVLAGAPDSREFDVISERLRPRVVRLGFVAYSEMAKLLAAADVVPIPSLRTSFSQYQVPAKLLDALAMGKAIVASDVSDMGQILGVDTAKPRGWVVPPADPDALGVALREALLDSKERRCRGHEARRYAMENVGVQAAARCLATLMHGTRALTVRKSITVR